MKPITRQWLRQRGACCHARRQFRRRFGRAASPSAVAQALAESESVKGIQAAPVAYWRWLAPRLLNDPDYAPLVPILLAYQRADHAAWERFCNSRSSQRLDRLYAACQAALRVAAEGIAALEREAISA